MAIVKPAIERKLSSLLGAAVTIDKLNVSLLGGSIEAQGVTVRGVDAMVPFLTIAKIHADIAVTKAFKGEIVIKSLAIERPVVNFVQTGPGGSNFPHRPMIEFGAPEEPRGPAPPRYVPAYRSHCRGRAAEFLPAREWQ